MITKLLHKWSVSREYAHQNEKSESEHLCCLRLFHFVFCASASPSFVFLLRNAFSSLQQIKVRILTRHNPGWVRKFSRPDTHSESLETL